ncbi:MAG: hypothetical protein MN733_42225 [Nitrososphaera sp.]|nr:hypothetical protein [Nitrososphaera sp.]
MNATEQKVKDLLFSKSGNDCFGLGFGKAHVENKKLPGQTCLFPTKIGEKIGLTDAEVRTALDGLFQSKELDIAALWKFHCPKVEEISQ